MLPPATCFHGESKLAVFILLCVIFQFCYLALLYYQIPCTVEPPNKGHFGANSFVPCREVVPISEVK